MSFLFLKAILVAAGLTSAISGQHVFGIDGKVVLCVPDSDVARELLRYVDESTYLRPGQGRSPGFPFFFSSAAMRALFADYVAAPELEDLRYVNALSGSVGFTSESDRRRWGPALRARDTEDEWYGRDKCPNPDVARLSDVDLYEVKCFPTADYASLWSRPPDHSQSMPNPNEFVVATCSYKSVSDGPYAGKTFRDCSRVVIKDGFMLDYRFQKENAKFITAFDAFLEQKLLEWKKNCSAPH